MKLGFIGMPDGDSRFSARADLALADSLNFQQAYFPKIHPNDVVAPNRAPNSTLKIALDAAAFAALAPTQIEDAVRITNDRLEDQLTIAIEMVGANATPQKKSQAEAFETLFSYDPRIEQAFPASRFPMKPPRPDIIGLSVIGAVDEARRAAARGYLPMTPSWLPTDGVARIWPAIVSGATSAVRRAQPSQWQINRMVVIHDDAHTLASYIYRPTSPYRRHLLRLAQQGLIDADIDKHLKRTIIAGSANKVANDILALRETVGEFGTLNIVDPAGSDPNITKNTMIRLAEDVTPMVTKTIVSPHRNLEKT